MRQITSFVSFGGVALLCAAPIFAQDVISARAGLVNYVQGDVRINGAQVEVDSSGLLPSVTPGQYMTTGDGIAEVLLTPGAFLRLGPESSFQIIDDRLGTALLEVAGGEALIEVGVLYDDNSLTVRMNGSETELHKKGIYQFLHDQQLVRVFDGKATTHLNAEKVDLKKGRFVDLAGDLKAERFDRKKAQNTRLYDFSKARSERLAYANSVAAQSQGYSQLRTNSWIWIPWLGAYSYLPGSGRFSSPFGYNFYSYSAWRSLVYYNNNAGSISTNPSWSGINTQRSASVVTSGPTQPSPGVVVRSTSGDSAPASPGRGRSR